MFAAQRVAVAVGFHQMVPGDVGGDAARLRPAPTVGPVAAVAGGRRARQGDPVVSDVGLDPASRRAGAFKVDLPAPQLLRGQGRRQQRSQKQPAQKHGRQQNNDKGPGRPQVKRTPAVAQDTPDIRI